MLIVLVTLLIAGTTLASPAPPTSNDVGVITCKQFELNSSVVFNAPVNYQATPGSNASFAANWVTGTLNHNYEVLSAYSKGAAPLSFEVCNSTFMDYTQGPEYYYGHLVAPGLNTCIQSNYPYVNSTPQFNQPCSYSDDSSQLLMYWALTAAPPYSVHFLGQRFVEGEPLGADLGPAAPPSGFVVGENFPVKLAEGDTGYFLGFVL